MKRYVLIPMLLLMFLCTLLLPGCKQPTPSTPGSTPQAVLPTTTPTTTAPTEPSVPDGLVTVYLLTGCTCEGQETAFLYDDAGKLLEVSAGTEVLIAYTYDDQGNCLSYKNTLNGIDQTYDAHGNILTDRTEDGIISNTYDEAGRCISVEHHNADGTLLSVTRYTYDDRGNLLSEILEQDGGVYYEILHTYDEEDRHLSETYYRDGAVSPEAPSYLWKYDDRGHLEFEYIYHGEALSQGTMFYYESQVGRSLPSLRWSPDGSSTQYSQFFSDAGNLSNYYETGVDAEGNRYSISQNYEYDVYGNTIYYQEWNHWEQGDEHQDQKTTYQWTYDENGIVMTGCSLISPSESYEYAWTYAPNGKKLKEIRLGDAPHEITWKYDGQGRVISVECSGSSAYQTTYVYDELGNLIQCSNTVDSATTVTGYTYAAFTVTPEVAAQLLAQQEEIFQLLNSEVAHFD